MMTEHTVHKEFYPDGQVGKIRILKSWVFDLSDFVTPELPKSCYQCPVGYSTIPGHPCGRNVPFNPEDEKRRPPTCRLRTIDEWLTGKEKPPAPKLWCGNQGIDENGAIICLAHLAEDRVLACPYWSPQERLKAKYPCSDHKEVEDE